MNESLTSENIHRPSAFGSFLSGCLSGLISGAVMAVIIAAISPMLGIAGATFLGTLAASGPLMVLASTLFGGVMGAKRALFDAPSHSRSTDTAMVPIPVPGIAAPGMVPAMDIAQDIPEQAAPTKSWVAETGRNEDSRSRIQQILTDGALSDKERASAILASRQAEANTQPSRA